MISKDSPTAEALHDYFLMTIMEDRAESAGPPLEMTTDDEESDHA